ncbi:PREDICTED: adhesion G-protein coupled receptor G7-like [Poecilia mexicana]|uniref:adhesion G-protein coupled receptor G7-like n=1 Tax=Poecilia mexicana TaxID=48701 RepID=UPI00072DEB6F|nr:PREDICTED: adhesion G-protein coupled receptor G7-like [Poecilia mexicana]
MSCVNGGTLNGVCVCPDEWTGETCSQAGKPQASTRCSIRDGKPQFDDPPRVLQCEQTLSDIQRNLTSSADLEVLASSAQLLTSRPADLTPEDVTVAAQIANTLLLSPNASETVRVAAVATVSQLLNATESDEKETNTSQSLTLTLDQLSVNLSLTNNTPQLVQPNLVVQSAQIPGSDTQGVQFTALAGQTGNFAANRIRLNTNVSKVTVDNGFIADALVYIRFPSGRGAERRQEGSNVSLGFVLYQNSLFFPSRTYRRRRASLRVLSASIGGPDRSVVAETVEMQFRVTLPKNTSLHDFSCVFWDYDKQDWNTHGCHKGNTSDGVLRCSCNHTTNFAALWSFREDYEYAEALGVLSIVGLSFSILGLVITIIHHLNETFQMKSRQKQTSLNSKTSLLCICLSLLAFIITFLSGVQNSGPEDSTEEPSSDQNQILESDQYVEPDRGSCTAVAALLHFFLLATFSWNSMYGTQVVLLVRSMQRSLPSYWTRLSWGVGWGVPAVVTAITLAATYRVENPLAYRQEEFCWLAALDWNQEFSFGKPMFWAFIVPLGLVLLYNAVLLGLTSLTTCRVDPKLNSTRRSSLTQKFLVSFSLAVLLGLSWTLGYLVLVTTGTANLACSILFCLCTTTQGLQIFILFTARTRSFRAAASRSARRLSAAGFSLRSTTYHLWKNRGQSRTSDMYRNTKDRDTKSQDTSI